MPSVSLNELKLIIRSRHIKGYKNVSKERLLGALSEPESVKIEKNLDNAKMKKIREEFNKLKDRFLKPKMKIDQRKSL